MGEWVTLADGSKLFCPYRLELLAVWDLVS